MLIKLRLKKSMYVQIIMNNTSLFLYDVFLTVVFGEIKLMSVN